MRMRAGSRHCPRCRTGAMLASIVKPSRTRHSSAHSDRSLIDHSGARYAVDASRRRRAAPRRSASNPRRRLRAELVARGCADGRATRSRGRRRDLCDQRPDNVRRPSQGRRTSRATPRERSSRSARVVSTTREGSRIPCACQRGPTPQMWNHSSTSTVNAFAEAGSPRRPPGGHAGFLVAVM